MFQNLKTGTTEMVTSSILWHFSSNLQTNTQATHIVPLFHQSETHQYRFRFLLHVKQLTSAACWVPFSTWIGFGLYELHVMLQTQNSPAMTINFNNFCDMHNSSWTDFCSTSFWTWSNCIWYWLQSGLVEVKHTAQRDNAVIIPLTDKSVCFQNALSHIAE
jgi:hypothetical protein